MVNKKTYLLGLILTGALLAFPLKADAFGLVVEHVLFTHDEPTKLADIEKNTTDMQLDLHQNLVTQVGATALIRQTLGDVRIMYEKDRLIETLKDYDTIMRSLLFFQIRDKSLISDEKNKAFKSFYGKLLGGVSAAAMSSGLNSAVMADAWAILSNILNNPVSPILQDKDNSGALLSDPTLAGENFKATQFLHAYTTKDRKRIPSAIDETMYTYRQALINEVATRNFLLGVYARSYLAERAEGNGIGRFLYGNEVILWDGQIDPWEKSLNIVGGLSGAITGNFTSALRTITTFISDALEKGVLETVTDAVTSAVDTAASIINSLTGRTPATVSEGLVDNTLIPDGEYHITTTSGAATDIKSESLQDICPDNPLNPRAPRDRYMECIWNKFMESKNTNAPVNYTLSSKDKAERRIIAASIRQMIAINTIMWVRASLEVSTLILLSSAQLEMEAILAMMSSDWFWIYPPSNTAWGEGKCLSSTDTEDKLDGTGWSQTCMTEQERLWLTPSFDWTEIDLGGAKE